ncbi:MAG: hypothetical protein M1434_01395 [Chloroflexi bacterium]|nr:hypothetical protein [Chloroflexota bacterium]MCL5273386.1 hypothetical protein [Chloroflexota bacterium]
MFINDDVIRQEAQAYNTRLDALFAPVKVETEMNLVQRVAAGLRELLGVPSADAQAKHNAAFMGHGVVAK